MGKKMKGADNISEIYSNISQYFSQDIKDLDEDEKAFIKEDASELIGELEGLIQRMEE